MLTEPQARTIVIDELRSVLGEDAEELDALTGTERLHELGLNSLTLARLIIQLEAAVGADPFSGGGPSIADIRCVDDLVRAYHAASSDNVAAPERDGVLA